MDAYETRKRDWEDLDVTREELQNLKDCLKKEEFRKLLIEYAEEVTDPENRKIFEKEITQLEKERGVDVTFVNPEPGYVIKTSLNGDRKCFVNICKSDIVARPSSQPSEEQEPRSLQWSIPYALVPHRDDLDKKNVRCTVFDVVFHPDTIYLASKNARFREMINNTAMDGVEKSFQVKLDRKNLKFPKMSYKGLGHPAVIRKAAKDQVKKELDMEPEIYQKLMSSYDESRERRPKRSERLPTRTPPQTTYFKEKSMEDENVETKYAVPKFSIKHQSEIELEDFTIGKDAKMNATVPKKLVVTIDLPLLSSAADATLDVQESSLTLKSEKPAKYLLDLPLPYSVNAELGSAKFDPKYKKLVVTLPVIRTTIPIANAREDSGVDSEQGSPVAELINDPVTDSTSASHNDSDPMPKLVEECQNVLASTVLADESETVNEWGDTTLRTSSEQDIDSFMNPSVKYQLPPFVCNIYGSQLAVTINVKNVDSGSISHRILRDNLGVHVLFTSLGAGFFPQHYSLCLKIAEHSVDPDSLCIEAWDNNVVITVVLTNTETLAHYYMGVKDEFMERRDLPTSASFKNQLKELMANEDTNESGDQKIEVKAEEDSIVINVSSHAESDEDWVHRVPREAEPCKTRRPPLIKSRSISESSGDEVSSNGSSAGVLSKGILKSRRNNFSRSVSESSADENGMPVSSSVDYRYGSIPDVNSESESSSLKKTVRFNDVVSRQLFRSNSSILGQRKKNQRKLRNKKRAQERRVSESENSENEDRDKFKTNSKDASEQDNSEVKSILHREKQEQQKTANIEISKSADTGFVHARKSGSEEEVDEDKSGNGVENAKDPMKAEFKNDLIFDLDM